MNALNSPGLEVPTIIVTVHDGGHLFYRAMDLGARAYLLKDWCGMWPHRSHRMRCSGFRRFRGRTIMAAVT